MTGEIASMIIDTRPLVFGDEDVIQADRILVMVRELTEADESRACYCGPRYELMWHEDLMRHYTKLVRLRGAG